MCTYYFRQFGVNGIECVFGHHLQFQLTGVYLIGISIVCKVKYCKFVTVNYFKNYSNFIRSIIM